MNHVLPVSGHPVVIHAPVCRSVDCIFCEDPCADKKTLEGPSGVLSLWSRQTERRCSDFLFTLMAQFHLQSIFELPNGTVKEVIKNDPHG
jgi:hypothetical protein